MVVVRKLTEQILVEVKGMREDCRAAHCLVATPIPIPLPTLDPETMLEYPEYMHKEDICDLFRISKSTFYLRMRNRLVFPLKRIGNRDYYCKQEVLDLLRRKHPHVPLREIKPLGEDRKAA